MCSPVGWTQWRVICRKRKIVEGAELQRTSARNNTVVLSGRVRKKRASLNILGIV